jgi:two-component system phosphate regulon response regulator PhoB
LRSIPFRFDDLFSFSRALGGHDQELPLPEGESVADGEWVLAIFEIGERRRATASAARGLDKGDGTIWLGFERRDWERLHTFSEAKSEKMKAAAPVAPPRPSPGPYESIPVSLDSSADITQLSNTQESNIAPQGDGEPAAAPVGLEDPVALGAHSRRDERARSPRR